MEATTKIRKVSRVIGMRVRPSEFNQGDVINLEGFAERVWKHAEPIMTMLRRSVRDDSVLQYVRMDGEKLHLKDPIQELPNVKQYNPGDDGYDERQEFLKEGGIWDYI